MQSPKLDEALLGTALGPSQQSAPRRSTTSLTGRQAMGASSSNGGPPIPTPGEDGDNPMVDFLKPSDQLAKATTPNNVGDVFLAALGSGPGLLIGMTMNLMLSVPFGLAIFPSGWEPFPVPRAIGIQMFLFSTFIGQVVMTFRSNFPGAMGMMMAENIPFMQSIAQVITDGQGFGAGALSTTMVAFAISTLLMGICFMVLGHYKLGRAVSYFPRHFIIGCIGGIGIFVTKTGAEVSTGVPVAWTWEVFDKYCEHHTRQLFLVAFALVVLLNISLHFIKWPLFPPFFFVGILPCFYAIAWFGGVPASDARSHGWLFDHPPSTDFWLMWTLFDFGAVRWDLILKSTPTFVALVCFGLMHAPINIPSLSMSTGIEADMDQELVVHGWTNIISGLFGGFPNYLCYSNSLLYCKCNGGGKASGATMSALLAGVFISGPGAIAYVPRCLAGCLLIHVGFDLIKEALVDSWEGFDTFEYASIVLITVTMTIFGMTPGLGLGMVLSAISFTLQNVRHCEPIRGVMPATTLRSSALRSKAEHETLHERLWQVLVVQLQGTLFFGNATALLARCEEELGKATEEKPLSALILDFTLVRSLESSAAETIAKIYSIAQRHNVVLVYNRGNTEGFPTSAPLSKWLSKLSGSKRDLYVADELDRALTWVEDTLLAQARKDGSLHIPESSHLTSPRVGLDAIAEGPRESLPVWQLRTLLNPSDAGDSATILFGYLEKRQVKAGEVLWYQGNASEFCFLLTQGVLENRLEQEAGTTEDCHPGCLVGEFHFLSKERRMGTLIAKQDSLIYVLTAASFEGMKQGDPILAFYLSQVSIRYLGNRCHHVSNRIWDTRCLPI